MKIANSKFYVLAGLALCGFSGRAMATPVGNLNVANCSGGGVTVSATTITWLPSSGAGTGCIDTGAGTSVAYSGGTLGAGVPGNIKNLTTGGGVVDMFMNFTGTPLDFALAGLGPGVANTNCASLTIGQTCSVFAGSPFILTDLAGGSTAISLSAFGLVSDGTGSSGWAGAFSTQINLTPAQIQAAILAGSSITSTHSAQFTITAVPEPTTLSMLLLGGVALLGTRLRSRKATL